jgi:hypothetical protein
MTESGLYHGADSMRQWSSQGNAVHLIDAQSEQLQKAVAFIDKLRAESQGQISSRGEVRTFTSDRIADALENVWLVVEVCWYKIPVQAAIACGHS